MAHRLTVLNVGLGGVDRERRALVERERARFDERVGSLRRIVGGGKRDRHRALYRQRAGDGERGHVEVAGNGKLRTGGERGVAVDETAGRHLRRAGERRHAVRDAPARDCRAEEGDVIDYGRLGAVPRFVVPVEVQELETVGVRRGKCNDGVPLLEQVVATRPGVNRVDDRSVFADAGAPARVGVVGARGAVEGEAVDAGGRRAKVLPDHRGVGQISLPVERICAVMRLVRKPGAVRLRDANEITTGRAGVAVPPRDAEPAERIGIRPGRGVGVRRAGGGAGDVEVAVDHHFRTCGVERDRERDGVCADVQRAHKAVRHGRIERKRRALFHDDRVRGEECVRAGRGGVCGNRVRAAEGERAGRLHDGHVAVPHDVRPGDGGVLRVVGRRVHDHVVRRCRRQGGGEIDVALLPDPRVEAHHGNVLEHVGAVGSDERLAEAERVRPGGQKHVFRERLHCRRRRPNRRNR